jgi:hypothetical protein
MKSISQSVDLINNLYSSLLLHICPSLFFSPPSPRHSGPPVQYIMKNSAIAPHDFSLTDNYYVFVENRAEGDTLPYILGEYGTL